MGRQDQERFDPGNRKHRDHGDGNDLPNLAHDPRDKHEGQEGHHVAQDAEGHRQGHVAGSENGGVHHVAALLPGLVYILAYHDGIVDHNAQGHDEGKHGDHVDGDTQMGQEEKGPQKSGGDAHGHPKGQLKFEKQTQQTQDQYQAQAGVAEQQVQPLTVDVGAIAIDGPGDAGRQLCFDLAHGRPCGIGDADRRLPPHAKDGQANGPFPIVVG